MSLRPSSRAEQRRKHSKKTIDADEARKKREEVSIEIDTPSAAAAEKTHNNDDNGHDNDGSDESKGGGVAAAPLVREPTLNVLLGTAEGKKEGN